MCIRDRRQSGRLSNPELEVELSRNVRSPEGAWSVGFKQQFPLTARLRLEKAISSAELAAAVAEVRNEERKLVGQVRTAAVKVLALKSQRAAREKQLATSKELADFLSLIHISEPTRLLSISYAVFCL